MLLSFFRKKTGIETPAKHQPVNNNKDSAEIKDIIYGNVKYIIRITY